MPGGSANEGIVLRAALDALELPVCVLDAAGVVRLASSAWRARAPAGSLEMSASFNYMRALEHLAAHDDIHARLLHDGIASVLAGHAPHFRLEYPVDAERREWHLLQAVALPDGGAALTHRDVTARRTAEARVRRLSRRYNAASTAGGVAVWDLELESQSVAVDAVLCRLLGYPVAQPQRWTEWRARVHAEDVALVDAVWQASCAPAPARADRQDSAFGPFEVRLADAHGGYRCFECRGQVVIGRNGRALRANGTLHDVTDRRAAQEALQRSNAHLQELARRLVAPE